jgi:hypothetical protein
MKCFGRARLSQALPKLTICIRIKTANWILSSFIISWFTLASLNSSLIGMQIEWFWNSKNFNTLFTNEVGFVYERSSFEWLLLLLVTSTYCTFTISTQRRVLMVVSSCWHISSSLYHQIWRWNRLLKTKLLLKFSEACSLGSWN